MHKSILYVLTLSMFLSASEEQAKVLHSDEVQVTYQKKPFTISRTIDSRCRKLPFNGDTYWSGNYPKSNTPDFCKKTFITTAGMLSPIKMYDNVDTYGELEVLDFIEDAQEDQNLLFIDTRKPNWYHARTIPTSVNIPFFYITEAEKHPKKFEEALHMFNVKKTASGYDFSKAKTLLLFCNATWCLQSTKMIDALVEMGYPHNKLKWYRGGLQAWLNVNLTTVTHAK